MSAIWNGPKNGSRKPNVLRTIVSRSSRVVWPSATIASASRSSAICRRLETKPARSATSAGCLPTSLRNSSTRSTTARSVAVPAITSMPGVHSGGLNQCTPRKRSGLLDALRQPRDRQRRGVGGDDAVGRLRRPGEDLGLELRVLGDGLDHQVGAVDRGLDVARRGHLRTQRLLAQQPGLHVTRRPLPQALERLLRQLRRSVGQPHREAGAREVPGDSAAHRPAAQHRNRLHAEHVPLSSGSHPPR